MRIVQNNLNRFDVAGINDPGMPGKKGISKTGIVGYKCKFIGWLLEKVFHLAVSVKTNDGNSLYLNRKSFVNWMYRVQPTCAQSKEEFSKLSHDSKFVRKAISDLNFIRTNRRFYQVCFWEVPMLKKLLIFPFMLHILPNC